jgi:hypothetical protein
MKIPFELEQLVGLLSFSQKRIWNFNRFTERSNVLRNYYVDLSKRGIPYWPYFTLHDEGHIQRVLNNLTSLISNSYKSRNLELNALELFVLIAAAYTHDIGMFLPIGEDDLLIPKQKSVTKVLVNKHQFIFENIQKGVFSESQINLQYATFIRDFHHWRSGIFIRKAKNAAALQIDDWRGLIALISEGHRKVDLYNEMYSPVEVSNIQVRVDLLAAFLRIADELDILRDRVPDALTIINSPSIDAETRKHWIRHFCTEGLSISSTKYGSLVIEIFHKLTEYDDCDIIHRRIKELIVIGINAQMRYTANIFANYGLVFPSQVNLISIDPNASVISEIEIKKQILFDIFFEREFSFHCPALQKYLGLKQLVTIEQKGENLICMYDENEHKKGFNNYCTASAGAIFDCGFCAAFGTATIKDKHDAISFCCPIYTTNANTENEYVTLNWIETKNRQGKYRCSIYSSSPKEWCHNCGFGGKATHGQVISI